MKHFARLFQELDQTTKTTHKIAALVDYFEAVDERSKLWTIALLSGKRPKRVIRAGDLRSWAAELGGIPLWLFEESYHVVGDLAETISLILPPPQSETDRPMWEWMDRLEAMRDYEPEKLKQAIFAAWNELPENARFAFNKLITGGFRIGVSQKLMVKALAQHLDQDENILSHRLMGQWSPLKTNFHDLLLEPRRSDDLSKPYPFYLAYALEDDVEDLGNVSDWLVERKWDGIRGQLIVRKDRVFVWSRGEELVTDRFPEFEVLHATLPDGTVLDGEILAYADGRPLPFQALQKRIGRKNVTRKILENSPVVMKAYDLLEHGGEDFRDQPMHKRRHQLEQIIHQANSPVILLSPLLPCSNWEEARQLRKQSREHYSEGLMLKHKDSVYKVGRKRGSWWKWKVDPLTIDAVMIYAMRGHGRRANLFTDFTFAVWNEDSLVPFTKAYSGLTDQEFRQVDQFVKKNTVERFGPVRSVKPELVFEIAFEGIAASTRHKSGVALRFPRMHRWRKDKPASEANTLSDLKQLLSAYGPSDS